MALTRLAMRGDLSQLRWARWQSARSFDAHSLNAYAVIPHGTRLQIDQSGTLYVSDGTNLLRVSVTSTSPATVEALPIPATASVSPDGRWAFYYEQVIDESHTVTSATHVWDLNSSSEIGSLAGGVLGWSPDNQIASWPATDAATTSLNVQSPAALAAAPASYAYSLPSADGIHATTPSYLVQVVWGNGPVVLTRPFDCTDPLDSCGGYYGLDLFDLSTRASRSAIAPSAGSISFVPTVPVQGFAFVTTTNCIGILRTSCTMSLLRVDLATATAETVVSPFGQFSLGISSDGHHVALAAEDGIYVKDLP